MQTIERTSRFKKDYKRESRGRHGKVLDSELVTVIHKLIADQPLGDRYRDHSLTGDWSDYRDCHLKPDLVLIYRKTEENSLQLVRMGSHSELGL